MLSREPIDKKVRGAEGKPLQSKAEGVPYGGKKGSRGEVETTIDRVAAAAESAARLQSEAEARRQAEAAQQARAAAEQASASFHQSVVNAQRLGQLAAIQVPDGVNVLDDTKTTFFRKLQEFYNKLQNSSDEFTLNTFAQTIRDITEKPLITHLLSNDQLNILKECIIALKTRIEGIKASKKLHNKVEAAKTLGELAILSIPRETIIFEETKRVFFVNLQEAYDGLSRITDPRQLESSLQFLNTIASSADLSALMTDQQKETLTRNIEALKERITAIEQEKNLQTSVENAKTLDAILALSIDPNTPILDAIKNIFSQNLQAAYNAIISVDDIEDLGKAKNKLTQIAENNNLVCLFTSGLRDEVSRWIKSINLRIEELKKSQQAKKEHEEELAAEKERRETELARDYIRTAAEEARLALEERKNRQRLKEENSSPPPPPKTQPLPPPSSTEAEKKTATIPTINESLEAIKFRLGTYQQAQIARIKQILAELYPLLSDEEKKNLANKIENTPTGAEAVEIFENFLKEKNQKTDDEILPPPEPHEDGQTDEMSIPHEMQQHIPTKQEEGEGLITEEIPIPPIIQSAAAGTSEDTDEIQNPLLPPEHPETASSALPEPLQPADLPLAADENNQTDETALPADLQLHTPPPDEDDKEIGEITDKIPIPTDQPPIAAPPIVTLPENTASAPPNEPKPLPPAIKITEYAQLKENVGQFIFTAEIREPFYNILNELYKLLPEDKKEDILDILKTIWGLNESKKQISAVEAFIRMHFYHEQLKADPASEAEYEINLDTIKAKCAELFSKLEKRKSEKYMQKHPLAASAFDRALSHIPLFRSIDRVSYRKILQEKNLPPEIFFDINAILDFLKNKKQPMREEINKILSINLQFSDCMPKDQENLRQIIYNVIDAYIKYLLEVKIEGREATPDDLFEKIAKEYNMDLIL